MLRVEGGKRGDMYIAMKKAMCNSMRVLVNYIEARLHGLEFNVEMNWARGPEEYPRCICGVRDKCKIFRI